MIMLTKDLMRMIYYNKPPYKMGVFNLYDIYNYVVIYNIK